MNFWKSKKTKTLFGLTIAASALSIGIVPTILMSTSQAIDQRISSDLKVYELSMPTSNTKLSDMTINQIDLKKAIYGSTAINGGNYMLGYMTLSNIESNAAFGFPSTINNWNWIQTFLSGSGTPIITADEQAIVVNNLFLQTFFNSSELSQATKFYLAIDINPNIAKENISNTEYVVERFATPESTWTETLILNQYNYFHPDNPEDPVNGMRPFAYGTNSFIDEFDELPSQDRNKLDKYIRNDASAVAYREMIDFVERWKPQMSSLTGNTSKESGFIAYTTTRTENEEDDSLDNLIKPFHTSSISTEKSSVDAKIEELEKYYLNKEEE